MFRITTLATIVFCAAHLAVAAQEVSCTEWTRTWDPGGGDFSTGGRIAVAPDGSIYTTGRAGESNDDIVLIKHDKSGRNLWVMTYDGPVSGNDEPTNIELTDEGVSLAGTSPDERGPATVLLDFDHDGALIRECHFRSSRLWALRSTAAQATSTATATWIPMIGRYLPAA